jgi:hypothetical protein
LDYYFGWLGSWVEGYAKCVARLAGMLLLFFFPAWQALLSELNAPSGSFRAFVVLFESKKDWFGQVIIRFISPSKL